MLAQKHAKKNKIGEEEEKGKEEEEEVKEANIEEVEKKTGKKAKKDKEKRLDTGNSIIQVGRHNFHYMELDLDQILSSKVIYYDQALGVVKQIIQKKMIEEKKKGTVCICCNKMYNENHSVEKKTRIIRCPLWHVTIIWAANCITLMKGKKDITMIEDILKIIEDDDEREKVRKILVKNLILPGYRREEDLAMQRYLREAERHYLRYLVREKMKGENEEEKEKVLKTEIGVEIYPESPEYIEAEVKRKKREDRKKELVLLLVTPSTTTLVLSPSTSSSSSSSTSSFSSSSTASSSCARSC